jgi:hypothetical protein
MKLLITLSFAFILHSSIFSQTKISGKFMDENNQPLPEANIYLKNTCDGVSAAETKTIIDDMTVQNLYL